MAIIKLSKDLMAPLDSVWDVIGDLDREPEFWYGTKSIKNISKKGNTIERDVVIAFRNSVCREIVQIDPRKTINAEIMSGPMKGTRAITLKSIDSNNTSVTVQWDIELSGFYRLFTGMVRKHIHSGTVDALERISKVVTKQQ
jgi:ribosome-associated toxin RatA of RatAB toxin-antitoxin module